MNCVFLLFLTAECELSEKGIGFEGMGCSPFPEIFFEFSSKTTQFYAFLL